MERNQLEENKMERENKLIGAIAQKWIQDFLKQITERLEKMEEMLVVDRIEGDLAICENQKTRKMQNIKLSELPDNLQEGNVLKWQNGKYELDTSRETEKRIERKMKDIWK